MEAGRRGHYRSIPRRIRFPSRFGELERRLSELVELQSYYQDTCLCRLFGSRGLWSRDIFGSGRSHPERSHSTSLQVQFHSCEQPHIFARRKTVHLAENSICSYHSSASSCFSSLVHCFATSSSSQLRRVRRDQESRGLGDCLSFRTRLSTALRSMLLNPPLSCVLCP